MTTTAPTYHVPVLLSASVDGLHIQPDGTYVDVTFGGGGHSRAILERLGDAGRLLGFDQDLDAMANVPDDPRFTFVRSNFRYLRNWLRYHDIEQVDGILADLGVSSHHFDDAQRGFSFRFDAPLDMRMNVRSKQTAADIVNQYDEEALGRLFTLYGELRNGRRLAAAIVRKRQEKPVETVENLISIARPILGKEREKKEMAKVFQALRIEVNREMDALHELLDAAVNVLRPGGRLVILTYHSLEDRMVKNYMRAGNADGHIEQDFFGNRLSPLRPVNNRVIIPDNDEQSINPRSRSAKLRIAERVKTSDETE